tara:strand:- start:2759 stop:3871 length:1113 start_codon:yes stop_codon:yes gene_type:complete
LFIWKSHLSISEEIQSDKVGQFGDFVGGVVGSIWALAGVILFYSALTLQRKEFRLQRRELKETRDVFQKQSDNFKTQQRENTFFNLLENHRNLVNSISFNKEHSRSTPNERLFGYAALGEIWKRKAYNFEAYKRYIKDKEFHNAHAPRSHPIFQLKEFIEYKSLFESIVYILSYIHRHFEDKEFYYKTVLHNMSLDEKLFFGAYLHFNIEKIKEGVKTETIDLFVKTYRNSDWYIDIDDIRPAITVQLMKTVSYDSTNDFFNSPPQILYYNELPQYPMDIDLSVFHVSSSKTFRMQFTLVELEKINLSDYVNEIKKTKEGEFKSRDTEFVVTTKYQFNGIDRTYKQKLELKKTQLPMKDIYQPVLSSLDS